MYQNITLVYYFLEYLEAFPGQDVSTQGTFGYKSSQSVHMFGNSQKNTYCKENCVC